ncbi:MAG: ImmA/IrrE family metallo-endopeptidase [Eubacteriales bacterium]|nr:ImmA/IrrE family metallo-endopeptidase [Eubacteriales bacterium]
MENRKYYSEQALESIARRTIKAYDPTLLLDNPRAIPIENIIERDFGLSVEYQYIRKNGRILGVTVFDDDIVPIYDMDLHEYILMEFKRGTIIIDASLLHCPNDGRLRFTCAHELAHWLLHQELYSGSGDIASMTENVKKSTDVDKAIEWQADKLGSDLLMPSGQVKIAYYRLRDKTNDIIAPLAEQFNVSKQAMEIKLKARHLI